MAAANTSSAVWAARAWEKPCCSHPFVCRNKWKRLQSLCLWNWDCTQSRTYLRYVFTPTLWSESFWCTIIKCLTQNDWMKKKTRKIQVSGKEEGILSTSSWVVHIPHLNTFREPYSYFSTSSPVKSFYCPFISIIHSSQPYLWHFALFCVFYVGIES